MVDSRGEGRKDDKGKRRLDLIPPEAIHALGDVLTFGAGKYADRNWEKGFAWGRSIAALQRHLYAWMGGEDVDPETGLSHMAHVLCNAVFLVTFEARGAGTDDRARVRPELAPGDRISLERDQVKLWCVKCGGVVRGPLFSGDKPCSCDPCWEAMIRWPRSKPTWWCASPARCPQCHGVQYKIYRRSPDPKCPWYVLCGGKGGPLRP